MFSRSSCRRYSWLLIAVAFVACLGLASAMAVEVPAARDAAKLPLTGEALDQILDGYADQREAQFIEQAPLLQAAAAVSARTDEQVAALANTKVTSEELRKKPGLYRGQVVTQSGILQLVQCTPVPKNDQGIDRMWLCYLSDGQGRITTIASLEEPESGLRIKKAVTGTGVFLKRLAFLNNRRSEDGLTLSPLVVCKSLQKSSAEIKTDSQSAVDAKLPKTTPEITPYPLVIQMQLLPYRDYWKVVVDGREYPVGGEFALTPEILTKDLQVIARKIMVVTELRPDAEGSVAVPVKFCIHANAQMLAVERVIMKLFRCKFVNIRYTTCGPVPDSKPNQKPDRPAPPRKARVLPTKEKPVAIHPVLVDGVVSYEYQGEPISYEELRETLLKIAALDQDVTVRVVYDDDTPWWVIKNVFVDLAEETRVYLGLLPIGALKEKKQKRAPVPNDF